MISSELLSRIEKLISKGKTALENRIEYMVRTGVDQKLFSEWQTQVCALLYDLIPADHPYIVQFNLQVQENYVENVEAGIGILQALYQDVEDGYLIKVEHLIRAEIFSDFLEMAEYFLEMKYKDSAALLTGAVLEDGLRKICIKHNITLKSKEDINSLNTKLADNDVYPRLLQKKINMLNDIRNDAVHGWFDKYTDNDVNEMINGVTNFLSDYLE